MQSVNADLAVALPEIILAVGAMVLLMFGVLSPERKGQSAALSVGGLVNLLSIGLLVLVGIVVSQGQGDLTAFNGLFVADDFARFAKVLILFSSAIMLLLGIDYLRRNEMLQFEYPVLVVFAALGMCMMVSAADLISLYMGLELQSLSLYVVASFRRDSLRSTEAGLKYFVLGALSSGLLLYGCSLIYGYAGSTRFDQIAQAVAAAGDGPAPVGLLIGLSFLAAGLAFKISAAPFHMWTPDVYEGAPTPVTALFSTAPKIAAGALFARAMVEPFGGITGQWSQILGFLALASMFLGAFAGIGQTNIKRLMAYSSIGHMGFALLALAAGGEAGVAAMLVYLTIYLLMNIGVFGFILTMTRGGVQVTRIADLAGLARTNPASAAGVAVLMFSLAGIPPLWGFFAKFAAFYAAIDAGLVWLAVAAVVASVISAYYYLRIVRLMYFSESEQPIEIRASFEHRVALALAALLMILAVAPFEALNGMGIPEAAARAAASMVN